MNIIESIFDSLSPVDLWEIRTMGTAAGDSLMDSDILTTKKIKISGMFSLITSQYHRLVGIAEDASAWISVAVQLDKDSQIEYEGIRYEIIQEIAAGHIYRNGTYAYSLRRVEGVPA